MSAVLAKLTTIQQARFEAWNDTLPFHLDTSPYEYARLAYQAATDAAIERCVTLVHDKLQPLGTFEHELVAALRALKEKT